MKSIGMRVALEFYAQQDNKKIICVMKMKKKVCYDINGESFNTVERTK